MTVVVAVGGLGAAAPGLWMSPADTDTVNARLRMSRRIFGVRTSLLPPSTRCLQKFCKHTRAALNPVARAKARRKICPQFLTFPLRQMSSHVALPPSLLRELENPNLSVDNQCGVVLRSSESTGVQRRV